MTNNKRLLVLVTPLLLFVTAAQAEPVSVHGFLAQGITQANGSNAINDDGDLSTALTELGINAKWNIYSRLKLSGQLVYLNGGNRYPEGVRLDYLFMDIRAC